MSLEENLSEVGLLVYSYLNRRGENRFIVETKFNGHTHFIILNQIMLLNWQNCESPQDLLCQHEPRLIVSGRSFSECVYKFKVELIDYIENNPVEYEE